MKYNLILISFLLFTKSNIAQTLNFDNFPFNKAVSIKLVSYFDNSLIESKWKSKSCIEMPQMLNGNVLDVDFSKMNKVKSIDLQQIVELYKISNFDIVCNDYIDSKDCIDVKKGYGIIFFNEFDEVFAVINFCFECNYWSRFPGGIFEPICPEKIILISKFFKDNGFE